MERLTKYIDGEARENHDNDQRKGFKNGNRAYMSKLAEYEDTGLTPEEIADHEQMFKAYRSVCGGKSPEQVAKLQTENAELKSFIEASNDKSIYKRCADLTFKAGKLEAENKELRELLGSAFKDLTRACTYSPCNSGICLTSECKGNIMPCNFKWQHQDRYNQIMKENDNG